MESQSGRAVPLNQSVVSYSIQCHKMMCNLYLPDSLNINKPCKRKLYCKNVKIFCYHCGNLELFLVQNRFYTIIKKQLSLHCLLLSCRQSPLGLQTHTWINWKKGLVLFSSSKLCLWRLKSTYPFTGHCSWPQPGKCDEHIRKLFWLSSLKRE